MSSPIPASRILFAAPAPRRSPNGKHAIDIHALECDEEVIAIFAGVGEAIAFR